MTETQTRAHEEALARADVVDELALECYEDARRLAQRASLLEDVSRDLRAQALGFEGALDAYEQATTSSSDFSLALGELLSPSEEARGRFVDARKALREALFA